MAHADRQKLHLLLLGSPCLPTVPTYLTTYLPGGGSATYLPTYLPGAASGSNTYGMSGVWCDDAMRRVTVCRAEKRKLRSITRQIYSIQRDIQWCQPLRKGDHL